MCSDVFWGGSEMKPIQLYTVVKTNRFLKDFGNWIRFRQNCNISAIEHLEDGYIWATAWDMELYLPKIPQDVTAIAIPKKAICAGPGKNGYRCRVESVVVRSCSCTAALSPLLSRNVVPLQWQLSKTEWMKLRGDEVSIHIPPEAIILLQDKI